jgi:hypothetical protein
MTTTQKLTKMAQDRGLTVTIEHGGQLVARDSQGQTKISAGFVGTKFVGGFIIDALGHVVHCPTVRDMVRFAS